MSDGALGERVAALSDAEVEIVPVRCSSTPTLTTTCSD